MKTTILKNIIKEEITKLQEQMNTNPNQYTIVPSTYFGQYQNLMSQQPGGQGFDSLSWAQNFQTTKLTQVANPCNFLKNQKNKLVAKQLPMTTAAMDAAGEDVLTTSTHNQLRQSNKHYDRLVIKVAMMQHMMFQNSCSF